MPGPARTPVPVLLVQLAPLVLVGLGLLDVRELLLAWAVETAAVVTLRRAALRGWWPVLVVVVTAVLTVAVALDTDWSPAGTAAVLLTGLALAFAVQLVTPADDPTLTVVTVQVLVLGLGLLAVAATADYRAVVDAGWSPDVLDGGEQHPWTTFGSGATFVVGGLSDALGLPAAGFPALLLVALKAAGETALRHPAARTDVPTA